ncbi:MAG: hypothetical protein EOP06_05135 [Proteobacteria bacterium]|nr:MAG: hypothetical protein EOP06_05135 [Pseudomonadota bacterium]
MAKETKQDRIVRSIHDQITEHMHDFINLEKNPTTKEADVERWCQSFLRSCLGFTSSAGYSIRAQEARGKARPDLVVLQGEKPILVVEVKKLGFDLNRSEFRSGKVQLKEYLHALGDVRWGMLCNGTEWKLYDFSNPASNGIEIAEVDLKSSGEILEASKKACEDLAWDFLDLHESSFSSDAWEELYKEATAFSPESLARAVLSADVVKYIAKSIRGEHEYKVNNEILIEKLYELLAKGLDDSILGWNESKDLEFQKYLKSQKRIGRKPRRQAAKPTTITVEQGTIVTVEVVASQPVAEDNVA